MTTVTPIRPSPLDYLGPAKLVQAEPTELLAELPNGERVKIELALAYGYQPAIGDELVVVGKGERWYVIGIIASQGEVQLKFNADVAIQTKGQLELVGDEGVDIRGSAISWQAETIKVIADSVLETAGSWLRKVKGLASLRSGEKHEVVDGLHATRAERAQWTARETVTVNGKEIHLG